MTINNPQLIFIASIKEKIRLAQYEALKEVNTQLIRLYWDIGKDISERQGGKLGQIHCSGSFRGIAEGILRNQRVFRM